MLHYKKLAIVAVMIGTVSSLVCQERCEDLLKKETGIKLLNYVVQEVDKAFLNEKPDFNQWDTFNQCFTNWFNTLDPKIKKIYALDAMGYGGLSYVKSIENNPFNQQMNPINLAIKDIRRAEEKIQQKPDKGILSELKTLLEVRNDTLAKSFIISYDSLPQPTTVTDKLPENIIDAYKKITNITFDPIGFLNAYNKTKSNFEKKYKKKLSPKQIVGILLGVPAKILPVVINTQLGDLETGVNEFINTLEELNYQSNRINKTRRFWQSKPKYLLNSSQIMDIEEIIEALYTVYPNIMTRFLQKRIEASENPYYKLQVILLAEAKTLMNVLQQYITKINSLLKK